MRAPPGGLLMAGRKGRSGRRGTPPHLKLVDGKHRRQLHGTRSDARAGLKKALAAGCPSRPKWVSDSIARAAWTRHATALYGQGLLTPRDVDMFGMWCLAYSEYRQLAKRVAKEGHTVPSGDGSVKLNPNVTAMNQAAKRARDLGIEFGLSPVARVRAPKGPKNEADEERAKLRARMGGGGKPA